MKASRLSIHKPAAVCPSVSNCLSSFCLWLSVCQMSGLAKRQMMHWEDRKRCFTFEGIDLLLYSPICVDCVQLRQKKRTQSANWEKDAIHGCWTTQLPQSTRTGIAEESPANDQSTHMAHLSGCHWSMNILLHKLNKSRPADALLWHEPTHIICLLNLFPDGF